MSYAETVLPEFDHEMSSTRQVLECVPDDKLEWTAGPRMNSIGWNASHLAEIPSWTPGILTEDSWDMAPVGGEPYRTQLLASRQQMLDVFDHHVAQAREAIAAAKDEAMGDMWSLLEGGTPVLTMPRAMVVRSFVLNHAIHHRAHLIVYLRLNGISVPGMYGPTVEP